MIKTKKLKYVKFRKKNGWFNIKYLPTGHNINLSEREAVALAKFILECEEINNASQ